MKTALLALTVTLGLGLSVRAEPAKSAPETVVSQLLGAVLSNDAPGYAKVASKLAFMAAPDFGVPTSLPEMRKALGKCSLTSMSAPKPINGDTGFFSVPVILSCPELAPGKPLPLDFVADGEQVYLVYVGGMEAMGHGPSR